MSYSKKLFFVFNSFIISQSYIHNYPVSYLLALNGNEC